LTEAGKYSKTGDVIYPLQQPVNTGFCGFTFFCILEQFHRALSKTPFLLKNNRLYMKNATKFFFIAVAVSYAVLYAVFALLS